MSPAAAAKPGNQAYVDDLVLRAQGLELAKRTQWRRLGYWRSSILGGVSSEVDGPFFLAKDGVTDPEAELEATLRGFFSEGAPDRHPRCIYPARFRWLKSVLQIDEARLPKARCPKLGRFVNNMQAESVTLIFSSYYLGNAASAFGHTFLRVNRRGKAGAERRALLDVGVNYSATVTTNNALVYGIRGMFGLFRGEFTALPYFYKVREYNDFESRDLWEYDLNLSPEAVAMLVEHIWELGQTYFDYWYMSENCSYHILTTLEAVVPSLDLSSHLHWPVIPSDTVKAVFAHPGLVRDIVYRPSARAQLAARLKRLSDSERDWVAQLADDPDKAVPGVAQERLVALLDAAADLIDVRHAKELVKTGTATRGAKLKQRLLVRRAELGVASEELKIRTPWKEAPHRGHGAYRGGLGGGSASERGAYASVQMRLALHDMVDASAGYPDAARLEFLPTELRVWLPDGRVELESTYFVRVAALKPISSLGFGMSWHLDAGLVRVFDDGCAGCLVSHLEMGGGLSASAWDRRIMLYAMTNAEVGYAPTVEGIRGSPVRGGVGVVGGVRLRFADRLLALAEGRWHWLPEQPSFATWAGRVTMRWMLKDDAALELGGDVNNLEYGGRGAVLVYF